MLSFQKTRIAPTPSGFLHLGNAFSFILTAALARQHGAAILLRIDDLDQARLKPEYLADIFETLTFLEIPWDEGPKTVEDIRKTYSQHRRLTMYQEHLSELEVMGKLFSCSCSRKDLTLAGLISGCTGQCCIKKPFALKLKKSATDVAVKQYASGTIHFPFPSTMSQFIVQKKDGFPSYHLASVVDDIHFGVDLVVRGADLWDSSLAQLHLSTLTPSLHPYTKATFFHHPLLTDAGTKLSKSAGHTSIQYLRTQGIHREAIYQQAATFFGIKEKVNNLRDFTLELQPTQIIDAE
ncbi:glutamate--tRNA ligase family protein [Lunatimonas salinarum]|uniref:glutamate--tRNA ligase family protein n=1 Tax=Lunatimonas salinarum TaxID=1774590 RepID=UPI001ADFE763|nr:glutamate--tRNA ligase family protein [Lunatimonas salinarum]